ncbi:MAG: hypothetical protein JNJ58_14015 [Chitinophagaceae bacterium]|nr:hypothetical protein [Chitinophagaceae bacterium]
MQNSLILFSAVLISFFIFNSCEQDGTCGDSNISQQGGDDSHNMGQNCMSCHTAGGKGEGCFKVAGTVYNSAGSTTVTSGTIKLYTGPNGTGTLLTNIEIDSKGNFYTTNDVNFTAGVYPGVVSSSGATNFMGSSISVGTCNNCHGVSTAKILAP